jgi:hypothetical protein
MGSKKVKKSKTHSRLEPNEKNPIIECPMMVRAHHQPITGFMLRRLFDAVWDPAQSLEHRPLKRM